jgi:hypothetical protein
MIMHPETSSQNARVRRNDMMKSAQNRRLARQLRTEAGTTQQPTTRRLRRPPGVVGRLLAAFQA